MAQTPTTVTDARNPEWGNAEHTFIRCEVKFSDAYQDGELIWLPWNASPQDTTSYGRQLFTDLYAGLYGDIKEFTITPDIIENAKEDKYSEINQWRESQENGRITFELDGRTWDCSKESQARLAPVVSVARAGNLPEGFFWTDASNRDIPMDSQQLFALEAAMQAAMVAQGFKIHERQRQMKKDVMALEDYLAVKQYKVCWKKKEQPDITASDGEASDNTANDASQPQGDTQP